MPSKKPESTKQAVVSKRLQGASKREIARDLGIHRETVDSILDESQVEAAMAQCRQDYLKLAPRALDVVERFLIAGSEEGVAIDKETFTGALQVLKGTGVHEERTRSRNDLRVSRDLTNASDEELDKSITELLSSEPPAKA